MCSSDLDSATTTSTDVDSCFYLTKGLHKIEYIFKYENNNYGVQGVLKDIHSDTTIVLKPIMDNTGCSISYVIHRIYGLKFLDFESYYAIRNNYDANYSFILSSNILTKPCTFL